MRQQLNRVIPKAGPEVYKTYSISSPRSTHRKPATCAQVDCEARAKGFTIPCDITTELGQRQAYYLRMNYSRSSVQTQQGDLVRFTFPPGHDCFAEHTVSLERPEFYLVRDGDWRGNPRGTPALHRNAADWVDDFATNQQSLADAVQEG